MITELAKIPNSMSLPSNDRKLLILLKSGLLPHIFTGFYREHDNEWLILTMEDDKISGGTSVGYKIIPKYYKIIKWEELPLGFEDTCPRHKGIIVEHQNL